MLSAFFKRFSGSHYRKFYRRVQPIVARINEIEASYQTLTDQELKAKTEEFRARFKNGESLDALLPEAFAAVKNTARRLSGQTITVMGQTLTWDMVHYDVQLIGGIALHERMIAEMATGEGKTLVATLPLYLNALSSRNCQLVTVNEYLAQRDAQWMGYIYNFLGLTVGVIRNMQPPPEKRAAYLCDITYGTASEYGFDYLRDNGMAIRRDDQVQRDHYYIIVDEVDSILVDEARTPLIISGPAQIEKEAPFQEYKPSIERIVRQQLSLLNRWAGEVKAEFDKPEGEGDLQTALEKLLQIKMGNPKHKQFMRLNEEPAIRKSFEKYDLEMNGDFNRDRKYQLKEQLYFVIDEKQHTADLTEMGRQFLRPGEPEAFTVPDLPTLFMEIDRRTDLDLREKEKAKIIEQDKFEKASEEIHTISQLLRAYCLYEKDIEYVVQEGKVMIVDENTGRVLAGRRWSDGLHQAVEAKENVAIEKETKTYATITIQNYFRLYEKLAGMTGTAETEANEFKDIYSLSVMVIPTHKKCVRKDFNDIIYKTRREKYNAVIEEIKTANQRGQPVLVGTVSVEASEVLSRMLRRQNIIHSVLNAKYHQQEAEIVTRAGQKAAVTIATNMAGRGTDIKLGVGVPDAGGLYVIGTERHTSRRIDRQLRGRCARQGDPGMSRFYLSIEDDLMRLYGQGFAGRMLENSFEEGQPLEHSWLNTAIERAQKTVEQQHYSIRKRLLQYDDVLNRQREVIYGIRNDALHREQPKETLFQLIDEELEYRLEMADIPEEKDCEESQLAEFLAWVGAHFPVVIPAESLTERTGRGLRAAILEKIRAAYGIRESVENAEVLRSLERYVIIHAIDHHWQDHLTEMEELRQSVSLRSYGQRDPLNEYKSEAFAYFEQMMNGIRTEVCTSLFRNITSLTALQHSFVAPARGVRLAGPGDVGNTAGSPRPATKPAPAGPGPKPASPRMGIQVPPRPTGRGPSNEPRPGPPVFDGNSQQTVDIGGSVSGEMPAMGELPATESGAVTAGGYSQGPGAKEIQLPKIELPKIGPAPVKREGPRPGRNDDCPCGSGKKYKKCCFPKYG